MFENLAMPLMCAPMSFASSPALARACCEAGVVGGWQGVAGVTPIDEFRAYLAALDGPLAAPPIVNLPARAPSTRSGPERLELLGEARAPLVLSSLGDPTALVDVVHGWGGRVIQDVTTMRHARKAIDAGVDGLMLTCAGAGGHAGGLTPMAFAPAVRQYWDGLLIVAGGIAEARGIAAALMLGADLACMGTRFIATRESGAPARHREQIVSAGADDVTLSASVSGLAANWLDASLADAGIDARAVREGQEAREAREAGKRPWIDIFSAGQSAGLIDAVMPVAELVADLSEDFASLPGVPDWRGRLAWIEADWA